MGKKSSAGTTRPPAVVEQHKPTLDELEILIPTPTPRPQAYRTPQEQGNAGGGYPSVLAEKRPATACGTSQPVDRLDVRMQRPATACGSTIRSRGSWQKEWTPGYDADAASRPSPPPLPVEAMLGRPQTAPASFSGTRTSFSGTSFSCASTKDSTEIMRLSMMATPPPPGSRRVP